MNLVILHGNGLVGLSRKLEGYKKQFDPLSIREINDKDTKNDLQVALETPSFFSNKRLVILENLDLSLDFEKISQDPDLTLILKFTKSLPLNHDFLKMAKKYNGLVVLVDEAKEVSIFPFLDMLAEKNPRALLEVDKLYIQFGSQYILTMIFYMLRRYLVASKKLPPFVIKKIELQKKNFSREKIIYFYKQGLDLDFRVKSGLIDEKIGLTSFVLKFLA